MKKLRKKSLMPHSIEAYCSSCSCSTSSCKCHCKKQYQSSEEYNVTQVQKTTPILDSHMNSFLGMNNN